MTVSSHSGMNIISLCGDAIWKQNMQDKMSIFQFIDSDLPLLCWWWEGGKDLLRVIMPFISSFSSRKKNAVCHFWNLHPELSTAVSDGKCMTGTSHSKCDKAFASLNTSFYTSKSWFFKTSQVSCHTALVFWSKIFIPDRTNTDILPNTMISPVKKDGVSEQERRGATTQDCSDTAVSCKFVSDNTC